MPAMVGLYSRAAGVLAALLAASVAMANVYYVSPTGSSTNSGTIDSPWSLSKANGALVPGDTAILLDGSYSTQLAPVQSGTEGSPITYRAQHSRQVILTVSNPRIEVSYRSYITIDGIKATNGNRWAIGNYASHITINDCEFTSFGNGSFETGRFYYTGGYIHITNSYFNGQADGIHIREGAGHYIANCTILQDEHSPLVLMGVRESVVTNCYFSNPLERCIEVLATRLYMPPNQHTTDYIVIQDSYFSNITSAQASAIKLNGSYSIVRRNVFDGCTNSALRLPQAYGSEVDYRPEGWFCQYNRLYNNTFYGNAESIQATRDNSVIALGGTFGHHVLVNNIIFGGSGSKQVDLYVNTQPADVAMYDNSIVRGSTPGQAVYYWNGAYTVPAIQAAFPAYNANNMELNPLFLNAASHDFHLAPGLSPCIDAGGPLTTTVAAGSGTVVPVADALFFTDGYGLIDGDIIRIGSHRVRVTDVNYPSSQLTVDTSINWTAGQPVYADYNGAGPDLGAFETQAANPQVLGRYVFYNNSAWDGSAPAASAADDAAIATDKAALLPGHTAGFANYTSYSRGINGIMLDVSNAGAVSASDFHFKVGNDSSPAGWAAPAPLSVSVRVGAGVQGSDRVTILFADGAITGEWLQVAHVPSGDVFYFGNAIGETGNSSGDAEVSPTDQIGVRNNPHSLGVNPATIQDAYDFDRDGKVGPTDHILCRNNGTNSSTALKLISVP